jgi:hypothetical protein
MSSPYPYFIPVSPADSSAGFPYPPVVLADPAGDAVSLISVQQSATAPEAPTGTGDFRWIETSTNIEYQWDAVLVRWVEVRPLTYFANATATIAASGQAGVLGPAINVTTEIVLSGFAVAGGGSGTTSPTDYYDFAPSVIRLGSGIAVVLDYAVSNQSFGSVASVVQRIDRKIFTIASQPTRFTVTATKFGAAPNFGNGTYGMQLHRVRVATP